jgi:hypothetical protein
MREYVDRLKCALCGKSHLSGGPVFAHEKAGRIHLFCSFKPELWKAWMQRMGMVPTPVDVEVVDSDTGE